MVLNQAEKNLLDAIDGHRTIAEILTMSLPREEAQSRLEMGRTFFERLWWHDQVVLDASASKIVPSTAASSKTAPYATEHRRM